MRADLAHLHAWIFDLDNTLYPASTNLFARIDKRIGAYVARLFGCEPIEARRIQKDYFHRHGTTLAGLMAEHALDPTMTLPTLIIPACFLIFAVTVRPEERRVGQECGRTCRSRWSPIH